MSKLPYIMPKAGSVGDSYSDAQFNRAVIELDFSAITSTVGTHTVGYCQTGRLWLIKTLYNVDAELTSGSSPYLGQLAVSVGGTVVIANALITDAKYSVGTIKDGDQDGTTANIDNVASSNGLIQITVAGEEILTGSIVIVVDMIDQA